MKFKNLCAYLSVLGVAVILSGCTQEGKYPLSGEECKEDDPVLSLDAGDCAAAPAGSLSGGL